MANLANAKKAIRVQGRKALLNKMHKAKIQKAVKATKKAIDAKDQTLAEQKLREATKILDKAAKRFMHKNTASRLKSRLAKKVNSIAK